MPSYMMWFVPVVRFIMPTSRLGFMNFLLRPLVMNRSGKHQTLGGMAVIAAVLIGIIFLIVPGLVEQFLNVTAQLGVLGLLVIIVLIVVFLPRTKKNPED